jgi:hypothetical protein
LSIFFIFLPQPARNQHQGQGYHGQGTISVRFMMPPAKPVCFRLGINPLPVVVQPLCPACSRARTSFGPPVPPPPDNGAAGRFAFIHMAFPHAFIESGNLRIGIHVHQLNVGHGADEPDIRIAQVQGLHTDGAGNQTGGFIPIGGKPVAIAGKQGIQPPREGRCRIAVQLNVQGDITGQSFALDDDVKRRSSAARRLPAGPERKAGFRWPTGEPSGR